eukprot:TRINITY_DN13161_c1_g1_i1.p1 TRINITY_DN13161_c1_g1~~TRINITY_DN13161_c1_g1_i1.p1  ORF type:complete len:2803 (+),score=720.64 TRINITY_DN13161_c1_g1_i1:59-8467(+)
MDPARRAELAALREVDDLRRQTSSSAGSEDARQAACREEWQKVAAGNESKGLEGIDVAELRRLVDTFRGAGSDEESGQLTQDEFIAAYRRLARNAEHVSDADLSRLFMRIDADESGVIDWEEFSEYFSAIIQHDSREGSWERNREFAARYELTRRQQKGVYHRGRITRIIRHPELDRYFTSSEDGTVKAWNSQTLEHEQTLHNGRACCTDLCILPKHDLVAVATVPSLVTLYHARTGRLKRTLKGKKQWAPDPTTQREKTTRIEFRLALPTPEPTFFGQPMDGLEGTRVMKMMQCRQNNFVQRMWAAEKHVEQFDCTLVPEMTCTPYSLGCYAAPSSPELLLVGLEDGCMQVYNVDDASEHDWRQKRVVQWDPVICHRVHGDMVTTVRTLQDRECVITSGMDSHIHVVHLERGTKLRTLRGTPATGGSSRFIEPIPRHQKGVITLDYSPDLKMLVSVGMERHVLVWNPFVLKPLAALHGHTGRVLSAIFNTADNQILTLSHDRVVRVWDVRTYRVIQQEKDPSWAMTGVPGALYFDPKREAVITGSTRLYVRPMVRAVNRSLLVEKNDARHRREIVSAVYNSKFDQVLTADPTTVKVWDSTTQKLVMEFSVEEGVVGLCFDLGGRRLVIACANGGLQLWNYGSAQLLKTMLPKMAGEHEGEGDAAAATGTPDDVGLNDAGAVYATKADAGHPLRLIIAAGKRSARFYKDDGVAVAPAWLAVPLESIGGATAMTFCEPARLVFGTGRGGLAVLHLGNIYAHPRCRAAVPLSEDSDMRGYCSLLRGPLHRPVSAFVVENDALYQSMVAATRDAEPVPGSPVHQVPFRRSSSVAHMQGVPGVRGSLMTLAQRAEELVWLRRTRDLVVSACGGGEMKIWNVRSLEQLLGWQGTFREGDAVHALATDEQSSYVFSGDESGYVVTYDVSRLEEGGRTCAPEDIVRLHCFRASTECISCIAWTERRGLLVVGSMNATVGLFSIQGHCVVRFGDSAAPVPLTRIVPEQLVHQQITSAHQRAMRLLRKELIMTCLEAAPGRTMEITELTDRARAVGGDIFCSPDGAAHTPDELLDAVKDTLAQLSPEDPTMTAARIVMKTPEGAYHYPRPPVQQVERRRSVARRSRLSSLASREDPLSPRRQSRWSRARLSEVSGGTPRGSRRGSVATVMETRLAQLEHRRRSTFVGSLQTDPATSQFVDLLNRRDVFAGSPANQTSGHQRQPPTAVKPTAEGALVRRVSLGSLPFRRQSIAALAVAAVSKQVETQAPPATPPDPPRKKMVRRAPQPRRGEKAYLTELDEDEDDWTEEEEPVLSEERAAAISDQEALQRRKVEASWMDGVLAAFADQHVDSRELVASGQARARWLWYRRSAQEGCEVQEGKGRRDISRTCFSVAERWYRGHKEAVELLEAEWEAFRPCEIVMLGVPPAPAPPRPAVRSSSLPDMQRSARRVDVQPRSKSAEPAVPSEPSDAAPQKRRRASVMSAVRVDCETCAAGLRMQEEFQRWVEAPHDTRSRAEARAAGIERVTRRFEVTCSSVSKRIVRELQLPASQRSVVHVPGRQWLFLHQGISYKLVTNPAAIRAHGGCVISAMKAAAAELRAMQALLEVPHCSVPLCCVVTYAGHRVFCAAALTVAPDVPPAGGTSVEPITRFPPYVQPSVQQEQQRGRPPMRNRSRLSSAIRGIHADEPLPKITITAEDTGDRKDNRTQQADAAFVISKGFAGTFGSMEQPSGVNVPLHHTVSLVLAPNPHAAIVLRHIAQRLKITSCEVPVCPDGVVDQDTPPEPPALAHISSDQGVVRCAYSEGLKLRCTVTPWFGRLRTRRGWLAPPAELPPSPSASRAPQTLQSCGRVQSCSVVGMELRRCGVSGRLYALHAGYLLVAPPPETPGAAALLSRRLHPRFVAASQHPVCPAAFSPLVPSSARSSVDRQSTRALKRIQATLVPDAAAALMSINEAEPTTELVLHHLRQRGINYRYMGLVAAEMEKLHSGEQRSYVFVATEQVVRGRDRSQPEAIRLGRKAPEQLADCGIIRPGALSAAGADARSDGRGAGHHDQRGAMLSVLKEEILARSFRDIATARMHRNNEGASVELLVTSLLARLDGSSIDCQDFWQTELIPRAREKYQQIPARLRNGIDVRRLRDRACELLGVSVDGAGADAGAREPRVGSPRSPAPGDRGAKCVRPRVKVLTLPASTSGDSLHAPKPGRITFAPLPIAARKKQLEEERLAVVHSCARGVYDWGPASTRMLRSLHRLARNALQRGCIHEATRMARHAAHCAQRSHEHTANAAAEGVAALLIRCGRPRDAMELLQAQLECTERLLGQNDWETCRLLQSLASLAQDAGDDRRALRLLLCCARRAKASTSELPTERGLLRGGGGGHRMTRMQPALAAARRMFLSDILLDLAGLLRRRRPQRAVAFCDEAISLRQRLLGLNDPAVAVAHCERARACAAAAPESSKVVEDFNEALRLAESELGRMSTEVADILDDVAAHHVRLRNYETSFSVLARALHIRHQKYGPAHVSCAATLRATAGVWTVLRRFDEAVPIVRRALSSAIEASTEDHPEALRCMLNLASLQAQLGDLSGALDAYHRVLVSREKTLGPRHPLTADAAFCCACLFKDLGDDCAADQLFDRVFELRLETLGYHHPQVGDALKGKAVCQAALGNLKESQKLFREALGVYDMCPHDPKVMAEKAHLLLSFAELQLQMHLYHDAISTLRRSEEIDKGLRASDDHPRVQMRKQLLDAANNAISKESEALDEKDHKRDNERKVRQWLQHTIQNKICRPPRERPAIYAKMERVFVLSDRIGEGLSTL